MTKAHTERWGYRMLYRKGIFSLTTRLFPYLGRWGFYLVSRSVACFYVWTQPAIREIVRKNLCLLTGKNYSSYDAAKVFDRFAMTIADYVSVGAMSTDEVDKLIEAQEGMAYLEQALSLGKGVILATGHYSFFELGAVVLRRSGYKVCIATLPEPTSSLSDWRRDWRRRWGAETVEVGTDPFSSFAFIRAIQDGFCTALLVDRPFNEASQLVDIGGGKLLFSTSPALFSWMTDCAILPVVIHRGETGKYRLIMKAPIYARREGIKDRQQAIVHGTNLLAKSLFEEIEKDVLQWYQFVSLDPNGEKIG